MDRDGVSSDIFLNDKSSYRRGKLTVFLGASAGVGKTYAMLEKAQADLENGVDIVAGWVETHGREETKILLQGLPIIEPVVLEYRNKQMSEMNIDRIIQLKPQIVLVDELAHTNVPGSRFVRRYQDVEEILQAGIDVYTTVNIQHIESLNDVVAQVTGVVVRETVPDYILEHADIIKLIDIPPEDLIKRLHEGKIFIPKQAERALYSFFRQGNLNALRELSLRFTAMQVEQNKKKYMQQHRIDGPWPTTGRVMVCVSASPFSAQLIRAAKRLADGLQGDFLAINVRESYGGIPLDENAVERLNRNMRLAEELGGRTYTIVGDDLVTEIVNVAKSQDVTAIIVGKSGRSFWWNLVHGSLVDKLIRYSVGMDVYVIQGRVEKNAAPSNLIKSSVGVEAYTSIRKLAASVAMVVLTTGVCWLFREQLELVNIPLVFLVPVLFSATLWGRKPAYLSALLGAMSFDFFFVPPIFTLAMSELANFWGLLIFLLVSFVIGGRTEVLRKDAYDAKQREAMIRNVHDFSRSLSNKMDANVIAEELAQRCAENLKHEIVVLLPDKTGELQLCASCGMKEGREKLQDSDYAVAVWSYTHKQSAGFDTQVLPGSPYRFIPLISDSRVRGVVGIFTNKKMIAPEDMMVLNAWVGLAALALDRVALSYLSKQKEVSEETEQVRKVIFNSVSHELKTPLATISGAVSALLDERINKTLTIRQELLQTIQEGSMRMKRIVNNLLDSSRFESGATALKVEWCDLQDVLGVVLRDMKEQINRYDVTTTVAMDLPLIRADGVLLEHVFSNVLDNAMKYSADGGKIDVQIFVEDQKVVCKITDQGCGVEKSEVVHIFEKFFRGKQSKKVAGSGLGLSICKNIITAHHGEVTMESYPGKGSQITFSLPVNMDNAEMLLPEEAQDDGWKRG